MSAPAAEIRVVHGVEIEVAPDGHGRYIVGYPGGDYADGIRPEAVAETVAEWARQLNPDTCPDCGFPIRERTYHRGSVYFTDLYCPACEWRNLDRVGGR